jgi:peptidoglycan/LPS O-acetylase OafA/YrhL
MLRGSYIAYVLQALVAVGIAASTPLELWWRVLVVASCIAYLPIPPVTWRYLEKLHQPKEPQP